MKTLTPTAANRLSLDYADEAFLMPQLPYPIIDVHTHLSGQRAAEIYKDVAERFGIRLTYSMTGPESAPAVKRVLGDAVRFIVTPDFRATDIRHALTDGFRDRIARLHKLGARMVKFWAAPRGIDIGEHGGDADAMRIDSPYYRDMMQFTQDSGLMAMVHLADPDTWFATKYKDQARYGAKQEHYDRFERVLDRFSMPFIVAHFGGSPEDLGRLDGLLQRHDNLYLDTSAAKWMIRELSRHPHQQIQSFFTRWQGRLLFGSDIVVAETHLSSEGADEEMASKAASEQDAFDLYASRYWALRTMYETNYDGESPIADPDLAMVAPEHHSPMDAPRLKGRTLDAATLKSLYHDAAFELLSPWYES